MIKKLTLLTIAIMMTACAPTKPPPQQATDRLYFDQTGHTVTGDFATFFIQYGGLESFGLPLTEPFEAGGWTVQYFERARLERHPENEPAYRVTAGWLGDLLQRRQPPVSPAQIPATNDNRTRYFPQTGHTLSGDFLLYFEQSGDTVRFGLPISEPFLLDGQLAQDFQSARFLWSPQKNPPVTLEDIGRVHFEQNNFDEALLAPVNPNSP